MVSSSSLIKLHGTSCKVVLGLKSTPLNLMDWGKILGTSLTIYESAVDKQEVFITKYRPNMTGHMSVLCAQPSTVVMSKFWWLICLYRKMQRSNARQKTMWMSKCIYPIMTANSASHPSACISMWYQAVSSEFSLRDVQSNSSLKIHGLWFSFSAMGSKSLSTSHCL